MIRLVDSIYDDLGSLETKTPDEFINITRNMNDLNIEIDTQVRKFTILCEACETKCNNVILSLLDMRVDVNYSLSKVSPLHLYLNNDYFSSAINPHIVKLLIENRADINLVDEDMSIKDKINNLKKDHPRIYEELTSLI